ncbi:MAG: Xaa-Pro peptidase family protein [Actinomycetota bacterium]|nr:Xaa-Pro peptidase family protein [Actinomycetota bacterium]
MSAATAPAVPTAHDPALTTPTPTEVLGNRIRRLGDEAAQAGADVVLIGPGADLRYFVGHSVSSHERFTCLAVTPGGAATLLVPTLERPGWNGTSVESLGMDIATWNDGQDPYAALAAMLPDGARTLAVDYYLPAVHALGMQSAVTGSALALAGGAIGELRMRKDPAEIAALAAAGAAIDRVQRRIGDWLRPGRTEREVAADIAAAIVEEGHAEADFVIVGSGPNGASPHHDASDRRVNVGDMVVVDIGGPTPAGYFSDCTRSYLVGPSSDPDAAAVYDIVRRAQEAGAAAATAGTSCAAVDEASRSVIVAAGYGEYFVTRTGHGIGMEVHEHPYLVSGNTRPLEPGMAFSVEPGIYLPGRFGVRIEDIVVVGDDGAPQRLNEAPTELITLDGSAS